MKKFVFTSVLFLAGIITLQAQADSDMVQWGVKAGANFSSVTGDDINSSDGRTGFHAGLLAEVPFSKRFSIQPELNYSQQGFKIAESGLGKAKYNLDYIQVPVFAKFFLIKGLNLQAAPQIGFNINEEFDYDTDYGSGIIDTDDSEINEIDFSLLAGLEYKFDLGVFINTRYQYGLTKLQENFDAQNSVFQVGVGYLFN